MWPSMNVNSWRMLWVLYANLRSWGLIFWKNFTKNIRNGQIFYVYCTCKVTKIEKNKFLNTDDTDIVKLPFYSVRSRVSIYAFKVSFPHIFIEIPGGMYTHMSVLSTKLHENSGFWPVFVLNERQPHGLYRYDTSVWTRGPLISRYKVCFCRPVFWVIV